MTGEELPVVRQWIVKQATPESKPQATTSQAQKAAEAALKKEVANERRAGKRVKPYDDIDLDEVKKMARDQNDAAAKSVQSMVALGIDPDRARHFALAYPTDPQVAANHALNETMEM